MAGNPYTSLAVPFSGFRPQPGDSSSEIPQLLIQQALLLYVCDSGAEAHRGAHEP